MGSFGIDKMWLDDLVCNGTENRIRDCRHLPNGVSNCSLTESVGITCFGKSINSGQQLRMVDKNTGKILAGPIEEKKVTGRLEIF